jgi:hypothetical protein
MTRIGGFEKVATESGYAGSFFTLTAPSKYHAYTAFGHRNHKWNGQAHADHSGISIKYGNRFALNSHAAKFLYSAFALLNPIMTVLRTGMDCCLQPQSTLMS